MTPDELRARRRALGLTQAQLAERLGRTSKHNRNTVSRWERGGPIPEWLGLALAQIEAENRSECEQGGLEPSGRIG